MRPGTQAYIKLVTYPSIIIMAVTLIRRMKKGEQMKTEKRTNQSQKLLVKN